jgi:hypothetical protein
MAQLKKTASVTNGSQAVSIAGDYSAQIKKNYIFLLEGELVPYFVAADSTFNSITGKTTFNLSGPYTGDTNPAAAGVVVTDYTYPDLIPVIRQGDVGTAAIFTKAMYRLQEMILVSNPDGLAQLADMAATTTTNAAAAATSATTATTEAGIATTKATDAATSATSAASSATAAASSAASVSAAATTAAAAATSATASANTASTASTTATTAATNAGNSATAAATSATNAAASATTASGAATTATTKAGDAAASATAAAGSATAAAASAASIGTAATDAANSATTATNAASAASTSAASAASSASALTVGLHSFNAKWLGTRSTDPMVDANGDALAEGAEYFNDVEHKIRVYSSGAWADYDASAETALTNANAAASAAAASQSAAATSATTASNAASTATTKASDAASSATTAQTAATTATTKASDASTSATNAANSASDAAASAASAASSASAATSGGIRFDTAQTLSGAEQAQAQSNIGFVAAVRATVLTGIDLATNAAVTATDTVMSAIGKLYAKLTGHIADTANPHGTTATQLGLGAVENKSSATIRGEITSTNVTTALGFTPLANSATTDAVSEGATNQYFTMARVRSATLTGLSTATNAVIAATDTVLAAFGKLQAQLTGHIGSTGASHGNVTAAGAAGFMTGADKTKLDGIATGATANSADATLLARANHTGTQLAATISDFASGVIAQVLTGLSTATATAVAATDSILVAIGKLQAQVSARLLKAGDTMGGALNWNTTATIASAATTDIGAATSNDVIVSGTTAITGLGTIAAGAMRKVKFTGVLTLTYNAASLILPGSANITTANGDTAQFTSLGSGNWKCDWYCKQNGQAVVGGAGGGSSLIISDTAPASPTDGQQWLQGTTGIVVAWVATPGAWVETGPGGNGADGTNGVDGAAATVTVGTVTTGAAGSSAAVTNGGTSTAAVLNFTIPKGDAGTAGAAATVAVGTTSTLAAGASATVTNSGSSSAATLNFGVPAGATGPAGPAAPKAVSILFPVAGDEFTLFKSIGAITVAEIDAVLRGSSTPSVTFEIHFGTDRSAAGTLVVTGGSTVTGITGGSAITALNNAAIPDANWVWLKVTAVSGTVNELAVSMEFA